MSNQSPAELAWSAWLLAHPQQPICTRCHRAFIEGYETASTIEAVTTAILDQEKGVSDAKRKRARRVPSTR